jgi:hypothetical protein
MPILILPELQQPFEIEKDASNYDIGTVLTQHGHPMAYENETLYDAIFRYPTHDKEMYSIVQACRQWKHYILGKEKIIHTNYRPLQFMQTHGKLHNDLHYKWSTYLQQFHLNIKYNKGSTNHVSDYISRSPAMALTTIIKFCGHEMSRWPKLYTSDYDFVAPYQKLSIGKPIPYFNLQDGLLFRLRHLYVPSSERANLIWEAHYSWVVGHFGVDKKIVVSQKHFYWLKLRQDVFKYIRSCTTCTITKPTIKKLGLYTPLSTLDNPWESISMDYMFSLSSTKHGNGHVFVVVDRFSKMVVLTPYKKSITVEATTNCFFVRVWVHFGLPQTIILD